ILEHFEHEALYPLFGARCGNQKIAEDVAKLFEARKWFPKPRRRCERSSLRIELAHRRPSERTFEVKVQLRLRHPSNTFGKFSTLHAGYRTRSIAQRCRDTSTPYVRVVNVACQHPA